MTSLVAQFESVLGPGWVEVVDFLRANNDLDAVASAVERGDVDGAVQGLADAARRFSTLVDAQQDAAGRAAAEWLDGKTSSGTLVSYDANNPRAVNAARVNQYQLIREISTEQRQMVRQVVTRAVAQGRGPLEAAKEIRQGIGLTAAQEAIVENYRRELRDGRYDDALARELSSGHSDRTVRSARDGGRSLTEAQIATAVDRYRDNWTAYRAETIARTESLRAVHEGTEELFRQATERGDVDHADLEREWVTGPHTGRDSPRPIHRVMDGQRRSLGDFFLDGAGNRLAYPGDPSAPANTTINCRCVVSTRYNPRS